MKKIILSSIIGTLLSLNSTVYAFDSTCTKDFFSKEEVSNSYGELRKSFFKFSHKNSKKIIKNIVKNTLWEPNRSSAPCTSNSRKCTGETRHWNFKKELIVDNFGNHLGFNGEIESKQFNEYNSEKGYKYRIGFGYSCVWNVDSRSQCQKWCSLMLIEERQHD